MVTHSMIHYSDTHDHMALTTAMTRDEVSHHFTAMFEAKSDYDAFPDVDICIYTYIYIYTHIWFSVLSSYKWYRYYTNPIYGFETSSASRRKSRCKNSCGDAERAHPFWETLHGDIMQVYAHL